MVQLTELPPRLCTFARFVLAAVVLLAPLQAAAEPSKEPSYTPQFKDCIDRSGGVTSDMLNCIATETEIQDAS